MHLTAEGQVENPWMNEILRASQVKVLGGKKKDHVELKMIKRSSENGGVKEITVE